MNRIVPLVASLALAGCVLPINQPPVTPEATPTPATLPVLPTSTQAPGGPLGVLRNAGPTTTTMDVGEQRPLAPLFLDGKGLVPTTGVVWTSSADGVVSVNPTTGDASAKAKGTAVVTVALSADPSVKAQLTITVANKGDVTTIEVTPAQATIAIGETQALLAKVALGTGEVKSDVVWSSSDEKIATVDASGTVTGKAVGTVQILASYAKDPNFKGQAAVRVTATKTTPAATPTPSASTTPDSGPDTVAVRVQGTWVDIATLAAADFTYMKFTDEKNGVLSGPSTTATTTDGGKTWSPKANPAGVRKALDGWLMTDAAILDMATGASVVDFKATYNESLADVARDGATAAYAITTTGKLFQSGDGGKTWAGVAGPLGNRLLAYNFQDYTIWGPIAAAPGGGLHYGYYHDVTCKNGSTGGYYDCIDAKSYDNDGSSWTTNTVTQQVKSLVFTNAKEGWRTTNLGGLTRTVDGGKTWIPAETANNSQGAQQAVYFLNPQQGVVLGTKGYYVTENDGRTWLGTAWEGSFTPSLMAVLDLDHMWAVSGGKVRRYLVIN